MKPAHRNRLAIMSMGVVGLGAAAWAAWSGPLAHSFGASQEVAGYATSLNGRTQGQRKNARLAARALNGVIIKPGAVFSFNGIVQGWAQDDGYVKAPVSFDGELVKAYGGGVCQTSTTLYNAALLAGLPILERHPHSFKPAYADPGRDAAVAYPGVDLRFKNSRPYPLKIVARTQGEVLSIRLEGRGGRTETVRLRSQLLTVSTPARLTRTLRSSGRTRSNYLRSPGLNGYRAVAWRHFYRDGKEIRREKLSDDTYAAMDRIVALAP